MFHGIVANVLDRNIVVSKFKLQPCCYIHFQPKTLGKGINLHNNPLVINQIVSLLFFLEDGFNIE